MNFKTRLVVGTVAVAVFIYLNISGKNIEKALTNDELQVIITTVNDAFDSAEDKILNEEPDDKPLGPDPDPEKCICKGTGEIVQGDGHVSECPYHKKPTTTTTTIYRKRLFPLFNGNL
jgi:hypothetical protein